MYEGIHGHVVAKACQKGGFGGPIKYNLLLLGAYNIEYEH